MDCIQDLAREFPAHLVCVLVEEKCSINTVIVARDARLKNKLVAVKLLQRGQSLLRYSGKHTLETLQHASLMHPLIIGCYEVFLTENYLCIVTEFAPGGRLPLGTHGSAHRRLAESAARTFFQQMIIAIEYGRHRGVALGNLKLEHLLLDSVPSSDPSVRSPFLKLNAFGFSENKNSKIRESLNNAPLENHSPFDDDIQAAGAILYELLTGMCPSTLDIKGERATMPEASLPFPAELGLSEAVQQLVRQIVLPASSSTLSLNDIINNPWFQQDLPPGAMQINELWLSAAPRLDEYPLATTPALLENLFKIATEKGKPSDPFISVEFPCRLWLRRELAMQRQRRNSVNTATNYALGSIHRQKYQPPSARTTSAAPTCHFPSASIVFNTEYGAGCTGENME